MDESWNNAQKWVVRNCDEEDVDLLELQQILDTTTCTYGVSLLHLSSTGTNLSIPVLLISNGVPINSVDENGTTPLHWACLHGNVKMVELLLSYKANIKALDDDDNSVLHYAAERGHIDVIKVLLNTGKIDIEHKNCRGMTALAAACEEEEVETVKFLIQHGALTWDILRVGKVAHQPHMLRLVEKCRKQASQVLGEVQKNSKQALYNIKSATAS